MLSEKGNKFTVTKPSSFFTVEPVLILDENGNVFYVHQNRRGKITFNLPVGEYHTKNRLKEVGFQPYVKFAHSFGFNPVEGYKAKYAYNPNKATISPYIKRIKVAENISPANEILKRVIGNSIPVNEYKPCITFLLGHEIAHRKVGGNVYNKDGTIKFDAEKKCDDISENYMLSHGWNPSQIRICKQLLLSAAHRKVCDQYDYKKFRR